jgi:hypothetical protein
VPGFGEAQGLVGCFPVAQFAHHDDVGRLAQGIFQGDGPVRCIQSDFPLCDQALLVGV